MLANVGEHVKRSQHQCQQHFKKVYLDALLHEATSKYVKSHGCFDWEKISEFVNRNISVYGMERTSKQLKTRYVREINISHQVCFSTISHDCTPNDTCRYPLQISHASCAASS
jgi:hypothetical protein